jgi:hypothetical protein
MIWIAVLVSVKNCGRSVGIVTGCGLDDRVAGIPSSRRLKHFHFLILPRPALGLSQSPTERAVQLFA